MTKPSDYKIGPPKHAPWIWLTREMLESPAWVAMSIHARRVLERIMIEHMAHAGTENGNLPVTYEDFIEYRVGRKFIKTAIVKAEALGWIDVVVKGRASFEDRRFPSRYALTWLPQPLRGKPASNRWREIKTLGAAKAVLKVAMERREEDRDYREARGLKGQTRKGRMKAVA